MSPANGPGAAFDVERGIVGIDIETSSAVDLKTHAAWSYSCHRSTIVYVLSWCYAEGPELGPVHRWHVGEELPPELVDYIRAGGSLLAHNWAFEHAIWANILVVHHDFPPVEIGQWRDSQAVGQELNLPSRLDGLAEALGTPVQKDKVGADLMRKMATAHDNGDGTYSYPLATDANVHRLGDYCDDDVFAMMGAWFKMGPLPVREARMWRLDQRINTRGVYLDQAYATFLRKLAKRRTADLADEVKDLTTFVLANSVAAPSLKAWLKANGVELPTITARKADGSYHKTETAGKAALAALMERDDLSPLVRAVIANRLEATKATSLAKLDRVPLMVGADGRLRNALKFHAANTGRWSSTGIQVHNLPKNKLSEEASALAVTLIEREDLAGLTIVEDRPLEILSQQLRSVIAAPKGRELIAADFSAIEACGLAWLADQDDKLRFLHNYFRELKRHERGECDKPQDLYEYAAESIGSDSRQLGKVAELALGYGMGDIRFASTAAGWGVPLPLIEARKVKKAWRETNVMVVRFWRELEDAARVAISNLGRSIAVGRLLVYANAHCLFVLLPSGRKLRYWKPSIVRATKIVQFVNDEGHVISKEFETDEIRFFTQNPSKSGMMRESTYGGKLVENATQAVARDLLAEACLRLDAAGYEIVMHVHDSIAAEVDTGTRSVAEYCRIMDTVPQWANGFPVHATGYRGRRFLG